MYGVRLLDKNYGQIGLLAPFNTHEEAAEAGFKYRLGSTGVGADGKPMHGTKPDVVGWIWRHPNFGGVRHLVVSPVLPVGNQKWMTVNDDFHHPDTYYRADRPGWTSTWPPAHEDQL